MSQNFDEPRLTSYALGEPLASDDLLALERQLEESAGGRAAVDEIRDLAVDLREAYALERQTTPADHDMDRIVEFSRPRSIPARVPWRTHVRRIAAMVALSGGVLGIGLIYWAGSTPRPLAKRTATFPQARETDEPSPQGGTVFYLGEGPAKGAAPATSTYANLRRTILDGRLPAPDSVRVRELVNHFHYREPDPEPDADWPMAARLEVASAPWRPQSRLARVHWKSDRDVTAEIWFNPARVAAYRRVGGDAADAIPSPPNRAVTELYEIIPADVAIPDGPDAGWVRTEGQPKFAPDATEILMVKFSPRGAGGAAAEARQFPLHDDGRPFEAASPDFQFAAAVAAFGRMLHDSPGGRDGITPDLVMAWARPGLADDSASQRSEFVEMVQAAGALLGAPRAGSS